MFVSDNLVSLVSAMDSNLSVDEVVVVLGCNVLAFNVVSVASTISFWLELILFNNCRERLYILKMTCFFIGAMSYLQQAHLELRKFNGMDSRDPYSKGSMEEHISWKDCKKQRSSNMVLV